MNEQTEAAVRAWQELSEARWILKDAHLEDDDYFKPIYNDLEILMIKLNGKFHITDLEEILNKKEI